MSTTGADGKALLAAFLEVLLKRLLLEAAGCNAVEIAADAALALILAEPAAFRSLGAHLRLQTLRNAVHFIDAGRGVAASCTRHCGVDQGP